MTGDVKGHRPGDETVVALVPSRSDAEAAEDLRTRMQALLRPVCALMAEANAAGLVLNFNIGHDQYGRPSVQVINVLRVL